MKNLLTLLLVVLFTTSLFAQKKELKAAQKAVDSQQFTEALSLLNSIGNLIPSSKETYQAQYYFLKGKALYANGTGKVMEANEAFNKALKIEKGNGKYTPDIKSLQNALVLKIADDAGKLYNDAIGKMNNPDTKEESKPLFERAAEKFYMVYKISPADTAYVQNSGLAYYFAGNYKNSNEKYNELLDSGYTGISKTFSAVNAVSGAREVFASEEEMNKRVKLKLASDPKVEDRPSQHNEIIKMIAKNYIALKDNEKALEAIHEAQKESPDDYGLLVDEANVYFAMGNNQMFKDKLEQAVIINPTDPKLHYNIGVMKMELNDLDGAIASFKTALKYEPDYLDAINNIGAAILKKAEPIVEEMNNSLSDFAKYDKLQAQQLDIYREALPYYEQVYQMDNQNITVMQTLMGIYENLEMYEKAKEIREIYNQLK